MLSNQCPDCGDDGLVVECSGWRELTFLAGRRLDAQVLVDGLRAGHAPDVESVAFVICLRCFAQGYSSTMRTAQP